MLQTLRTIEQYASRIERAYLRRRPQWRELALDSRIWSDAVAVLMEAHRQDSRAPIDPELFVVCIAIGPDADPWMELTHPSARRRYLSRVRAIIRSLRGEITREVRRAEQHLLQGRSIDELLQTDSRQLSPLGRYLVAIRQDRPDLARQLRDQAQTQHFSCPLYRAASANLISPEAYEPLVQSTVSPSPSRRASFSLN